MTKYDDGSESPLNKVHCYISTHTPDGKADFHEPPSGTSEVTLKRVKEAAFSVHYTTNSNPVKYADDQDLKEFYSQPRPIPIALKKGSVLRMVDVAPGEQSPMHATSSLDYGVVLQGEVILILEDYNTGPRRTMRPGDVSVQHGTKHAWRDASQTDWARMLYVLLDAEAPGKEEEDWGGIELPK